MIDGNLLNDRISYYTRLIEMKKSAYEYQKSAIRSTGQLDLSRLYKYQITENLFKTYTDVPESLSHGLVILVDFSASMQHILKTVMQQVYILIQTCRNHKIPYAIYGFTDSNPLFLIYHHQDSKEHTRKVFNSFKKGVGYHYGNIRLGMTPLYKSFRLLYPYVSRHKQSWNVDKLMFGVFTDGCPTDCCSDFITTEKSTHRFTDNHGTNIIRNLKIFKDDFDAYTFWYMIDVNSQMFHRMLGDSRFIKIHKNRQDYFLAESKDRVDALGSFMLKSQTTSVDKQVMKHILERIV